MSRRSAERRCARPEMLEAGVQTCLKYAGPVPRIQSKAVAATLYSICWRTGSQWSMSRRTGVTFCWNTARYSTVISSRLLLHLRPTDAEINYSLLLLWAQCAAHRNIQTINTEKQWNETKLKHSKTVQLNSLYKTWLYSITNSRQSLPHITQSILGCQSQHFIFYHRYTY